MFTRISSAGLLIALSCAGCGDATQTPTQVAAEPSARGNEVTCALRGADSFEKICTIERVAGADGIVLTIRHPDGGFRRLRVTGDGRGVIAADGAEPARVTIIGDGAIEVMLGGDGYRLPATVRGRATP